ncbi:unnamed protein product [Moneuplotes crassus]|uniref:Uncharacterized protein n=1 Tax=Euplotes crassus TaxID=5936 RepID=A0AAD1UP52_EUPCR|nr:unnamed protein product [Moneuplotes crassus]
MLSVKSELKPEEGEFEKSNDHDKSDFHTEQIDSPSTSKNLDNIDRESEEWEGISNKIFQSKKNNSPEVISSLREKGKIHPSPKIKKKVKINGSTFKNKNKPNLQNLNKGSHYLAIGPRGNQKINSRKTKIYSQNRQLTSKTDDVGTREGGEYIRKITQRTNTIISNFSEFPNHPGERQVKLKHLKPNAIDKYRSRTVKKKGKGNQKLNNHRISSRKGNNNQYYNVTTNMQKNSTNDSKKLCCDFCNSEIVQSIVEHSEPSHLAISKFGRTNTGSIISEEESSKNGKIKASNRIHKKEDKKMKSKNKVQHSRYTKTDATRTDTKSYKKTYSREPSISSNISGGFSKKRSLPRRNYSPSRSSNKRKGGEYLDSESTSSVDDFTGSKGRIKNLHLIGFKNLNTGFPEKIKEENEEATTKTKVSGKMNNFSSLHKKRTEVEKDKKNQHLHPNMFNKKEKIRKTLSDPSTIKKHIKSSSAKKRPRLANRVKHKINNEKFMSKNSSISSITKNNDNIRNTIKKDQSKYHKKKNSVVINGSYKVDGNLILACSKNKKKGYKTAGTTVKEKSFNPKIQNWKSPDAAQRNNMYSTTSYIHSERQEYNNTIKKSHRRGNYANDHYESHRDISPYQVENFIEMLHNFGVSDSMIKKKIIASPMGHGFAKHEGSIESNLESSSQIKNPKARLPTIKSQDNDLLKGHWEKKSDFNGNGIERYDDPDNVSSDSDANILLPNLNTSQTNSKKRSPLKQKIKNRRNLRIKQSWDKKSTKNSDFTTKMLRKNLVNKESPDNAKAGKMKSNPWIGTNHQSIKKKLLAEEITDERIESPGSRGVDLRSEYYGTYAKVSESNVN